VVTVIGVLQPDQFPEASPALTANVYVVFGDNPDTVIAVEGEVEDKVVPFCCVR
jgi:hypothetical protein